MLPIGYDEEPLDLPCNVYQRNEPVFTDTGFSDTSGVTAAQIFWQVIIGCCVWLENGQGVYKFIVG
jgi:hypothetical protein